jgi:hypothetical protein
MDFAAETINKILEISTPEMHTIKDVHGIETVFSTKPLHQVKATAPEEPSSVDVVTLAGFANLIQSNLEGRGLQADNLIHIENERTVTLKSKVSDEYGRRLVLISAQPVGFKQFQFGQWIAQEEFVIGVASLFAESPDKQYVLSMASSLTNDAATNTEDDGFTQRVNLKAGLRLKESVTLKPRVDMAPYRTFPEIDQPVSQFVLRARCEGESKPMLMLVEADGGRWKIDAIATIRAKMESFGLNIPIIA